jgi:hypothetical protein
MAIKRKTNKAKRTDGSCRNNGSCAYCRSSRTHATRKRIAAARDELKEYLG